MGFFEGRLDKPLNLYGVVVGRDANDNPIIQTIQVKDGGGPPPAEPKPPLAPALTGTQDSRTQITVTWTAADNTGRPVVTGWRVQRRSSTDNGANWSAWADISGSPFAATTFTKVQTGLPTGTPEVEFQYQAAGVNGDGLGDWSNTPTFQWSTSVINPPSAPSSFTNTATTLTSASLSWSATADNSVTKYGIFEGATLKVDNIDKTARTFTWSGMASGSTHNNVSVARANLDASGNVQWSQKSNTISFTLTDPPPPPPSGGMMMGCSSSPNSHGGTEDWEGWRIYTNAALNTYANRTGTQRPSFVMYSDDTGSVGEWTGQKASGASTAHDYTYNYALGVLNDFYYGGVGNTHSARWGIQLFYSIGNENYKSASLPNNPTQADIDKYVNAMHGLYDAVHYAPGGVRRFPDAYAGSDPTTGQEKSGWVQQYLHPSAQYHDFVGWSMYPSGRSNTVNDPTFDWPSLNEADQGGSTGYMIRCFYRTFQAQAAARQATGNSKFSLMIGCGEVGCGQDPNDSTTRPYWAVHGLAGGMQKLANKYGLTMAFACWWDNSLGSTSPQNILSDEPATTNPSTRQAWQNWKSYNHEFKGTHPASWAGDPKSGWKTTGPVV